MEKKYLKLFTNIFTHISKERQRHFLNSRKKMSLCVLHAVKRFIEYKRSYEIK